MTTHRLLEKIEATWQANNEQNIKHTSQFIKDSLLRKEKKKKRKEKQTVKRQCVKIVFRVYFKYDNYRRCLYGNIGKNMHF